MLPWIKSVTNHLYWVAASTPSADGILMTQKWLSVQNHIQNVHEGHGDLFNSCTHGELTGRERRKRWLKPGSKVCEKFQYLVSSRQMRKDIPMLSTGKQTSCLEAYHSVINHFAPKMIRFSYHGQMCRLMLAALHFNENTQREQLVNKNGEACFRIVYPKFKKGEYTVKNTLVDPTYEYVDTLKDNVMNRVFNTTMLLTNDDTVMPEAPPPLCEKFVHPLKEDAISELRSRFSSN